MKKAISMISVVAVILALLGGSLADGCVTESDRIPGIYAAAAETAAGLFAEEPAAAKTQRNTNVTAARTEEKTFGSGMMPRLRANTLQAEDSEEKPSKAKEDEEAEKKAAEKAAKEKAKKEAAEKAAKEKAEKEAAEKAAKEKAEKEAAEKAAKEKAEKEAAEKAAKEKAEKEAAEKAAKEKAAKEKAEKEAAEKAAKEAAEKEAAEKKAEEDAKPINIGSIGIDGYASGELKSGKRDYPPQSGGGDQAENGLLRQIFFLSGGGTAFGAGI